MTSATRSSTVVSDILIPCLYVYSSNSNSLQQQQKNGPKRKKEGEMCIRAEVVCARLVTRVRNLSHPMEPMDIGVGARDWKENNLPSLVSRRDAVASKDAHRRIEGEVQVCGPEHRSESAAKRNENSCQSKKINKS